MKEESRKKREEGLEGKVIDVIAEPGSPFTEDSGYYMVWQIKDMAVIEAARRLIVRYLHAVENFAQYMQQRLVEAGVMVDFESKLTTTPTGATVTIMYSIKGLRRDFIEHWRKVFKWIGSTANPRDRPYRRAERAIGADSISLEDVAREVAEELGGGATGDSGSPTSSEKAEEEG